MNTYNPGLHIVATISASADMLNDMELCRMLFDNTVEKLLLQKVGDAYHKFTEGGYTGVVCLTESHCSIHTWPEYGIATFDVFLSNFRQENDSKVREFFDFVVNGLNGTVVSKQEIKR